MDNQTQANHLATKKEYIKPEYKLEKQMTFMFDAIKNKQSKVACRQCSSCHGCR